MFYCSTQSSHLLIISSFHKLSVIILSLLISQCISDDCGWYSKQYSYTKQIPLNICGNYIVSTGYRSTMYSCNDDEQLIRETWLTYDCKDTAYGEYEVLSGYYNCSDPTFDCDKYSVIELYTECTGDSDIGDLASQCTCTDSSQVLIYSQNECLFDDIVSDKYYFKIVDCSSAEVEIWYFNDNECNDREVVIGNLSYIYRETWEDGCQFAYATDDVFSKIDIQSCKACYLKDGYFCLKTIAIIIIGAIFMING